MLVISCIKQVPDTTQVAIDPVTNNLKRALSSIPTIPILLFRFLGIQIDDVYLHC